MVRDTASKYKGLTFHKSAKKWQVSIVYNGKREYLGLYETELQAHNVYEKRFNEVKHLITSRINNTNYYVEERELRREILISLAMGQLTRKMIDYIILIVKKIHMKFRYNDENHKYDCYSYAIENILTRWYNYDPDKYELVLPYFSELAKRSFAFHWSNHIAKHSKNMISIEGTYDSGRALNI